VRLTDCPHEGCGNRRPRMAYQGFSWKRHARASNFAGDSACLLTGSSSSTSSRPVRGQRARADERWITSYEDTRGPLYREDAVLFGPHTRSCTGGVAEMQRPGAVVWLPERGHDDDRRAGILRLSSNTTRRRRVKPDRSSRRRSCAADPLADAPERIAAHLRHRPLPSPPPGGRCPDFGRGCSTSTCSSLENERGTSARPRARDGFVNQLRRRSAEDVAARPDRRRQSARSTDKNRSFERRPPAQRSPRRSKMSAGAGERVNRSDRPDPRRRHVPRSTSAGH